VLVKFCEVVNYGLEFLNPLLTLLNFLFLMQLFSIQYGNFASKNLLAIFDFVFRFFQIVLNACGLTLQFFIKSALTIQGVLTFFKRDCGLFILSLDVVQLFKHLSNFLLLVI